MASLAARKPLVRSAPRAPVHWLGFAVVALVLLVPPGFHANGPEVSQPRLPVAPAADHGPPVPLPGGRATPGTLPAALGSWATQDTLFLLNNTLRSGNVGGLGRNDPDYVAYDPQTGELYAAIGCTIEIVDPSTFQLTGSLTASAGCEVLFVPSTGDLYLANSGNITIVDPSTDTVVGRIHAPEAGQTGQGLFVYDPAANAIIVANAFSTTANVVGLTQGAIIANLSIDVYTYSGVYNPVNQEVYLAEYENDQLLIVNSSTWATTGISLSSAGIFDYGVTVDPTTGDVYATTYFYSNGVVRISPTTNKILNFTGLGSYPTGLAFDNVSDVVYLADGESSTIDVLNPVNLSIERQIHLYAPSLGVWLPWWPTFVPSLDTLYVPTAEQESLIAIDGANDSVYGTIGGLTEPDAEAWDGACSCLVVGDFFTGELWFVNTTTWFVNRSVNLGGWIRGITYDNQTGDLWVGLGGLRGSQGVEVLYGSNGTEISLSSNGYYPNTAAFDAKDDRMYVPIAGSNEVGVYNASNRTLLSTIPDSYASGAAWDPSNDEVYVGDWEANNVTVYFGGNGTLVTTIQHVPGPNHMLYDPTTGDVYAGDENAANVSVLDPTTNRELGNLSVPSEVQDLSVQPGSDNLSVTTDSNDVTLLDLATNSSLNVSAGTETAGLVWLNSGVLATTDLFGALYVVSNRTQSPLTTPTLTFDPSTVAEGEVTRVYANASGGSTPYSYNYSGLPGCVGSNASTFNCTATTSGPHAVTLRVSDVSGARATVSAELWVDPTYLVTFRTSGLPSGVPWWVNVTGGASYATTGGNLSISRVNGSFHYSIGVGGPWAAVTNATGTVAVDGAARVLTIDFERTQTVTFQETGLAPGTDWQVSITGESPISNTAASQGLGLLPGSYAYAASATGGGYAALRGEFNVTTGPVTIDLTFVPVLYSLSFYESGLPTGAAWWVNLTGGASLSSSSAVASVDVANGTIAYVAQASSREWRTLVGSVQVNGAAATVSVAFVLMTYTVTFSAPGVPAGDPIWVNFTSGPTWSGFATVSGSEPNGTYLFVASAGVGWASLPGRIAITGALTALQLNFSEAFRTVMFQPIGLGSTTPWSVGWSGSGPASSATGGTIGLLLQRGVGATFTVQGPADQRPLRAEGTVAATAANQTIQVDFPVILAVTGFAASPSQVTVGGSSVLTAVATGGRAPLNYSFSAPAAAGCGTPDGAKVTCAPTAAGTYSISVNASDGAGSYANDSLSLTAVAAPVTGSSAPAASNLWEEVLLAAVIVGAAIGGLLYMRFRRRRLASRSPAESPPEPGPAEEPPPETGTEGPD